MWVLFVFLFSIFKTLDAVSEFWFDAHWSVFTNEWILLSIFFYDEAVWYCNLKHPVFLHKNTIAHYEFWFTSLTSIKWKLKHSLYYFLNIDTDEYSLWLLIRWVFLQNLRMMLLDCKLTHRVFVQIMILTNES